jgi:hypothetical protein
VGTTTSPCAGNYPDSVELLVKVPVGPDQVIIDEARAGAGASDNAMFDGLGPLPSFSGRGMWAGAIAGYSGSSGTMAISAEALASPFNTFDSVGPSRAGFIEFDVVTFQAREGDSRVVLTDGIQTYTYQAFSCSGSTLPILDFQNPDNGTSNCWWNDTVPFDLGTKFLVTVSANVNESLPAGSTGYTAGDANASVLFRLLEADGTTVVPFSVVPEPSTWGLLLLGLAGSGRLVWRSRIKH